ncbi:MAG: hypothetical protein HY438_04100 [DPANN group archaeon]|nr:hypothetical protein [DPANN group archaeon]
MKLYFATTNTGKLLSFQRDLGKYNVKITQLALDVPEPRSSDVVEIAKEKVNFAYKKIRKPVVANDSGFYIHSLNGFPRAFVNFALETIGLEGLLKLVENKPRECEFRECLAYLDNSLQEPKCFTANSVSGRLAYEVRGTLRKQAWSALWLIFIPDGSDKTLGEMTEIEYENWHRPIREKTSATVLFGEWLAKNRLR